jgi:N-acyl-D-aspartate/D-glutamate deacylase
MEGELDLIVRGGTTVDGSGGEPYTADVGIAGGRIAVIDKLAGSAANEIDARGSILTPGFVDIHTHYDGQVTWEHRVVPSSSHGVTTVDGQLRCRVRTVPSGPARAADPADGRRRGHPASGARRRPAVDLGNLSAVPRVPGQFTAR